jgi:hypothetical protein
MLQSYATDPVSGVLACLDAISPDVDRSEWLTVLTALAANKDLPNAEAIAQQWSQKSDKFNQQDFTDTWLSINRDDFVDSIQNPMAFLLSIAKRHGFNSDTTSPQAKSDISKLFKPRNQSKSGQKKQSFRVPKRLSDNLVKALFNGFSPYTGSDYARKKGLGSLITPDVAKRIRTDKQYGNYQNMVVPCFSIETGKLSSYQTIFGNSDKPFLKGASASCCWFPIKPKTNNTDFIFLSEGITDALAIHHALDGAYVSASLFGTTSFKKSVLLLQQRYPNAQLICMPDGDEAGTQVFNALSDLHNVTAYRSPNYTTTNKDPFALWKQNKKQLKSELTSLLEMIRGLVK